MPQGIHGAFGRFTQQGFELGKELLDWIEVGRVGRQVEQRCARGLDGLAYAQHLVSAEIIQHDDVAWRKAGHEDLLDIGQERVAVHGPVDHARCGERRRSQGCYKGRRLPVPLRNFADEAFAARSPTAQPGHVGCGAGLVDEDQVLRIEVELLAGPFGASCRNVRPILLGGAQAFF